MYLLYLTQNWSFVFYVHFVFRLLLRCFLSSITVNTLLHLTMSTMVAVLSETETTQYLEHLDSSPVLCGSIWSTWIHPRFYEVVFAAPGFIPGFMWQYLEHLDSSPVLCSSIWSTWIHPQFYVVVFRAPGFIPGFMWQYFEHLDSSPVLCGSISSIWIHPQFYVVVFGAPGFIPGFMWQYLEHLDSSSILCGSIWSTWIHYRFYVVVFGAPGFIPGLVRVSILFLIFCVVLFVLFVFVLCFVHSVACISGWSILDCTFGFLYRLLSMQEYGRS